MKRKIVFLCCLLAMQVVVFGQRKISGTLASSEDNSTLFGVVVKVVGTRAGTVTGIDENILSIYRRTEIH